MPPRAKFTREQITKAALEVIRRDGTESLTARALAKQLGSSACPIFTVFESMEEVKCAVIEAAKELYKGYVEKGLSESPAFKGAGRQYIQFAMDEPRLFQLLFMTEQESIPDLENVLPLIDESYDRIFSSITEQYGVTDAHAESLYQHLWIYTHGIAALCATRLCRFTEQKISEMMTEVFTSLLRKVREDESND